MAQTSGFFEATWDESLIDPDTGLPGAYDIRYYAYQFANYFSLFVGNGVFASPTNQLKVSAGVGKKVVISAGWAYINGYWYHNDSELILDVPSNSSSVSRVDSVKLRYSESNKTISAIYSVNNINVERSDSVYELKLAEVVVPALMEQVLNSNITDTRSNENVCGFVKGLVDVVGTDDLFQQYNAIFNEWFDTIKGQLVGDLAVRLQLEFQELNQNVEDFESDMGDEFDTYKTQVNSSIQNIQQTADNAYTTMNNFVNNDFVIQNRVLTFTNKQCIINDNRITANSLIDVYFTADSMTAAENAVITVDSASGQIILTAESQPSSNLVAQIRVRVLS